jgi:hypothetical protein
MHPTSPCARLREECDVRAPSVEGLYREINGLDAESNCDVRLLGRKATGRSEQSSPQHPGSSSLLVTLFGGWGWPVHSGPLGVHYPHGEDLRPGEPS